MKTYVAHIEAVIKADPNNSLVLHPGQRFNLEDHLAAKLERSPAYRNGFIQRTWTHEMEKFRDLNVAVRLEMLGEDVWLIPNESARMLISKDAISFLPEEFEFLTQMDVNTVKAVYLLKKAEPLSKIKGHRLAQ